MIGVKWDFKTKYIEDGSIEKHRARLVAKGCSQQRGVDFTETFSLAARMQTIKTALTCSYLGCSTSTTSLSNRCQVCVSER